MTEDFNGYIKRKRESHCHGNHIEMQAMCEIYNRTIEVYQYGTGKAISCIVPNFFVFLTYSKTTIKVAVFLETGGH